VSRASRNTIALRLATVGAALSLALIAAGCRRPSSATAIDGGAVAVATIDVVRPLAPFEEASPALALQARVAPHSGACAQVRALQDENAAAAVAADIRAKTGLPVEVLRADLGPRGIWHRLCVGEEESVARIVARATRWTSPGGLLEPFLDPPEPRAARFLVHERAVLDPRTATVPQARALLGRTATPGPKPSSSPPPASVEPMPVADGLPIPVSSPPVQVDAADYDVWYAGSFEHPLVATTATASPAPAVTATSANHDVSSNDAGVPEPTPLTTTAPSRVVVVDVDGRLLSLDPAPPPGCASCLLAEQKSPVVSRRAVGAGDVHPAPGAELLVEEETGDGTRLLTVLRVDGGMLRRAGAVLLAQHTPGVALRGDAVVAEGDGDESREIAVSRLELRFDRSSLCAMTTRAEVWSAGQDAHAGLTRVDVLALASGDNGDAAVVDYITAVDAVGDRDAASRACARVLATRPGTLTTQLCLQRVRSLLGERQLVAAVNAAGTLSEGAPSLRAVVAGPLFEAMSALDEDPRLSASSWDCATTPLVPEAAGLPVAQVIAQARTRLLERVGLADVVDGAFVTAARDFGPDTPVGQIASRWLERLRVAQPARHAALEALLLPSQPAATTRPSPATTTNDASGSKPSLTPTEALPFGGAP
jgi:hypothetical protein